MQADLLAEIDEQQTYVRIFRNVAETRHHAIAAIRLSRSPLCEIAHVSGFADQAHMSRAVGKLAGMSPALLRRLLKVTSEEKSLNEHGS